MSDTLPKPEITLEHIRQAAEWAAAAEVAPLEGRTYKQDTWDCGTACCA